MSDNAARQHVIAPTENAKVSKIPGVKMRVDIGKNVVVRIPDVESSYRGRIVGYDPYEYIVLSVRLPSRVRQAISQRGQIILKYLHKGTVYGFRTYVIDAIRRPAPLVFIEYPSIIEKIELRRQTRCEVNIDGSLHTRTGEHECLVMNISTTGCKISARAAAKDPPCGDTGGRHDGGDFHPREPKEFSSCPWPSGTSKERKASSRWGPCSWT